LLLERTRERTVDTRFFVPGGSVHVIRRGNNRGAIYRDDIDRLVFLKILREAAEEHGTAVHGFVLMTTHYHALATPDDAKALPRTMKAIGDRYVRYFNRKYDRIGSLWAGRYRAIPVDTELYWLTCLRYIEQNPVRAADRLRARPGVRLRTGYGNPNASRTFPVRDPNAP
jgi:putative transposase